jgi:hypothetical protein
VHVASHILHSVYTIFACIPACTNGSQLHPQRVISCKCDTWHSVLWIRREHVYGCCCSPSCSEQSRYAGRWLAPAQHA